MTDDFHFTAAQRRFEEPDDFDDLDEIRPGYCAWCGIELQREIVDGVEETFCPNSAIYIITCGYDASVSEAENVARYRKWEGLE